jgi:hypothetical protein
MSAPHQTLKTNLFGELFTLRRVILNSIEQEYYELIAARIKQPLHQALLDPFFYYHLKLNSVDSLEKLPCEEVSGLMNTPKNQIEIWFEGKRIHKLKMEELNQDQYLFPLYAVEKEVLNVATAPGIYIEQKEVGYIGSYEAKITDFAIENIKFELAVVNHQQILQNITYNNAKTTFKKKETLITYQNSFII